MCGQLGAGRRLVHAHTDHLRQRIPADGVYGLVSTRLRLYEECIQQHVLQPLAGFRL
jgi:hypothetical protein